jgi:hypothetical protein
MRERREPHFGASVPPEVDRISTPATASPPPQHSQRGEHTNGLVSGLVSAVLVAAIVAFLFAGFHWLRSTGSLDEASFVRPSYVRECQKHVLHDVLSGVFRANFDEIESGETYRLGQPDRTTGYYTTYRMTYGNNGEAEITCYSDLAGRFVRGQEVNKLTGPYPYCFYPNRSPDFCNSP